MFLGWEGVGLCSYLLIGFWYDDRGQRLLPASKAFIVNRIGDFGFLLGIFLLFWSRPTPARPPSPSGHRGRLGAIVERTVTLRPGCTASGAPEWRLTTLIGICLFMGAMGKSAQIPLYVWLPDAMAGPTPVSALIHAATMVTAGVYMVARMNFLFARPRRLAAGRLDRRDHRPLRRHHRHRPERHQEGPRLLHGEPARLHVRGGRRRGLSRRHLPPDDPRLLQGPALPRRRRVIHGHAQRAGHPQDGRPAEEDALDLLDVF